MLALEMEEISRKIAELKLRIDSLECKLQDLKDIIENGIRLNVEIPKVILEKKPIDIRIGEEELPGRIILLAKEGFFNKNKTASEVASELMRRCWHPKDLRHVRPSLEQLTALGILNRMREKKQRGKGLKWVYRIGNPKIVQTNKPDD